MVKDCEGAMSSEPALRCGFVRRSPLLPPPRHDERASAPSCSLVLVRGARASSQDASERLRRSCAVMARPFPTLATFTIFTRPTPASPLGADDGASPGAGPSKAEPKQQLEGPSIVFFLSRAPLSDEGRSRATGLAQGMVDFAQMLGTGLGPGRRSDGRHPGIRVVKSARQRMLYLEPEKDFWICAVRRVHVASLFCIPSSRPSAMHAPVAAWHQLAETIFPFTTSRSSISLGRPTRRPRSPRPSRPPARPARPLNLWPHRPTKCSSHL